MSTALPRRTPVLARSYGAVGRQALMEVAAAALAARRRAPQLPPGDGKRARPRARGPKNPKRPRPSSFAVGSFNRAVLVASRVRHKVRLVEGMTEEQFDDLSLRAVLHLFEGVRAVLRVAVANINWRQAQACAGSPERLPRVLRFLYWSWRRYKTALTSTPAGLGARYCRQFALLLAGVVPSYAGSATLDARAADALSRELSAASFR